MHGRVKRSTAPTEAELEVVQRKIATYTNIVGLILSFRQRQEYTVEALQLTSKLLANNPDFYTIWNYRKEILCHLYPDLKNPTDSTSLSSQEWTSVRDNELSLTADCIRKNTKSCMYIC